MKASYITSFLSIHGSMKTLVPTMNAPAVRTSCRGERQNMMTKPATPTNITICSAGRQSSATPVQRPAISAQPNVRACKACSIAIVATSSGCGGEHFGHDEMLVEQQWTGERGQNSHHQPADVSENHSSQGQREQGVDDTQGMLRRHNGGESLTQQTEGCRNEQSVTWRSP